MTQVWSLKSDYMPDRGFSCFPFDDHCKIFPNPARDFVIFDYDLKGRLKTGEQLQVSIVGMDGKQKMVKITDKMQDQILVETTLFKAGVYICTISVGKKKVESTEFTVIH